MAKPAGIRAGQSAAYNEYIRVPTAGKPDNVRVLKVFFQTAMATGSVVLDEDVEEDYEPSEEG